jgi:ferrous iron transport protein A
MLPLGLLAPGEKAVVVGIKLKAAHGHAHRHGKGKHDEVTYSRIEDLGLRAEKEIEVLNNEGRGPLLIKVNDSRIAIAREVALKIMVRKENQ